MKLYEEDFPTISLSMKSYMDLNNIHVIPHMIEEVSNFKASIEAYLRSEVYYLIRHMKVRQLWF